MANNKGYIIGTVRHKVSNILFGYTKDKCLHCGVDIFDNNLGFCSSCQPLLIPNNGKTCIKCGRSLPTEEHICDNCNVSERYFDKAYSMFVYEGMITNTIYSIKFGGRANYCEVLASYIHYLVTKHNVEYDVVCSVPMTKKSKKIRGYNQAQLLAMYYCDIIGSKVYCDSLTKVQETTPQERLSKIDRLTNLSKAYKCTREVKGKRVLLIDDVMTTGATLNNCSKVLRRAGATSVVCITVCSGTSRVVLEENNV